MPKKTKPEKSDKGPPVPEIQSQIDAYRDVQSRAAAGEFAACICCGRQISNGNCKCHEMGWCEECNRCGHHCECGLAELEAWVAEQALKNYSEDYPLFKLEHLE